MKTSLIPISQQMELGGEPLVFPESRLRELHDPNHKIQVVCSLSLDSGKHLSVP